MLFLFDAMTHGLNSTVELHDPQLVRQVATERVGTTETFHV